MPLNEALARRRSRREFLEKPLSIQEVSQLCWAGQGVTSDQGYRTAPSAGAIYGIRLYVVDRQGVSEYRPQSHSLDVKIEGHLLPEIEKAALDQTSIGSSAACFVIAIDVPRMAAKYGSGAERYCLLEAGHVAQNILLEATALELGAVPIGAMQDHEVARLLKLPSQLIPVYLLPVGHPSND